MTSLLSLPQAAAWFCVLLPRTVRALRGRCAVGSRDCWCGRPGRRPGRAGPTSLLAATNWQAMSAARLASSGVRTRAGQDGGAAGHLRLDVGARHEPPQDAVEPLDVGADGDFHQQDLLAPGVEEEGVGLAFALGDQEYAVGGLHDGVDLVGGGGDDHVLELEGKLQEDRLAEPERYPLHQREIGASRHLQHRVLRDVLESASCASCAHARRRRSRNCRWPRAAAPTNLPHNVIPHGLPTFLPALLTQVHSSVTS